MQSSGIETTGLEAFSDGVFAIAITLLIVEVHLGPCLQQVGRLTGANWGPGLATSPSPRTPLTAAEP